MSSSRLIFRNLPPTIDPSTFRTHILQPPQLQDLTLTDLKLVPRRRFAFVGYKTEEEAGRVKGWFDGTFLGSGKIQVDFVDDETLAKKQGKSASFKSTTPTTTIGAQPSFLSSSNTTTLQPPSQKKKSSKALDEFMSVMKGAQDGGVGGVEEAGSTSRGEAEKGEVGLEDGQGQEVQEGAEVDDAEWLRRRQAVVSNSNEDDTSDPPSNNVQSGVTTSTASPEESLILSTHRLFLRNLSFHTTPTTLRTFLQPYLSPASQSQSNSDTAAGSGGITEIHLPTNKSTGGLLGTAFVEFERGEDALRVWREADGRTVMGRLVHILPGRGKFGPVGGDGSGVVGGGGAVMVVDGDGDGHGDAANGGHANEGGLFGKVLGKEQGKNVKSEVDKRRKDDSQRGLNWASLYMNSDAVVSSVADRMGIKKSDILNSESMLLEDGEGEGEQGRGREVNGAVKLALAETSVINETKKYFEKHGVILTRLEGSADVQQQQQQQATGASVAAPPKRMARSKTTLLVKNIPYGTTLDVLRALFEPFGKLKRTLLPPAGTLAVVEFEQADDAFRAFKGVSYKRLGNALVYLEKAPEGLMRERVEGEEEEDEQGGGISGEGKESDEVLKRVRDATAAATTAGDGNNDNADSNVEPGSTLYVKSLSFATTTERLSSVFSSLPSFAFARVSTKPDPKNPSGPRLSMGFGFVGFKTRDAANKALKGLKGYKLDGHALEVKFAQRDREGDEVEGAKKGGKEDAKKGGKTTKMIVKNVPFEATKKDIKDLFSAYGTLKSCRIPKKHNSGGRGFAFLDFTTRAEAEAVMEALKHTHLLGRHLVLEWAAEEEFAGQEVERLREKAKREFVKDGEGLPSKKRKLGLKDGLAVGGDAAEED